MSGVANSYRTDVDDKLDAQFVLAGSVRTLTGEVAGQDQISLC